MHKVLVLGAGMVAQPLVHYLLDLSDFQVAVASRTVSKAEAILDNHPHGEAMSFDIADTDALSDLVANCDLAVSLMPHTYHVKVAEQCLRHGKHLVTTSYVGDAMRALDQAAGDAGVILLNEIGLDPGIDHMSAMRIIHQVQQSGAQILSFTSWCGGLPAPEANTNPLGYKFSWSPRGVIMAGRNDARYLRDGDEVSVPGPELFDHYVTVPVEGLGDFEGYPNRDSLPFIAQYGIDTTSGMFRGTLRNLGWCQTLKKLGELGFFSEEHRNDLEGRSFQQVLAAQVGISGIVARRDLAAHLDVSETSTAMSNLEWLGLLSQDPIPPGAHTLMDVLTQRMLNLMSFEPGERDLIILKHEFLAQYPQSQERITSTLIDYGIPHGDSAMARTVSLPAAIAVRLILQGQIDERGVQTPVIPSIYNPVLTELEELGIRCDEVRETI